jgi:hypothetical protein
VLRIIHIRKRSGSLPAGPAYDIIDAGQTGEVELAEGGIRSATREQVGDWLACQGLRFTSIGRTLDELDEKGSAQVQMEPRLGPRIVRAWFDTALNPIIDFLEVEGGLLDRRNWTFSFAGRVLEFIQPVQRRFFNANLEQILAMNLAIADKVEAHDSGVETLLDAVVSVHDSLVASKHFVELCDSLLTADRLRELGVGDPTELFGAYNSSDRYGLIAQYVVNGTGDLPPHYSTAKLWNRRRGELLQCLTLPRVKERVGSMNEAGRHLASIGSALEAMLKGLRQELSLTYDVAIIPSREKMTA